MALPDAPDEARFEQAKRAFFAGLSCQQAGDFDGAEVHYRESLRWVPRRASTLINLAFVQLRLGQAGDALASAGEALASEPDSVDALLHRATARARLGRLPEALADVERLLALQPAHAAAWGLRGGVLRELQRLDEAALAFEEALRLGADVELNAFYLAAVRRDRSPPAPPAAYVQGLFDAYADDFDRHLVEELRYEGHRRLIDVLARVAPGPHISALDLGCGTGLCGPLLRPMTGRLTGVDLSAPMLDKARALGVYDRLVQGDAAGFLRDDGSVYDLLVAADVFIYLGSLEPLFAAADIAMTHGTMCFSVELCDDDADFLLQPSLRYAHSRAYLRRLAATHRFEVLAMARAAVREDQKAEVTGLYVCLRRGASAGS